MGKRCIYQKMRKIKNEWANCFTLDVRRKITENLQE